MENKKTTHDVDWEKRFAKQDAKLAKQIKNGEKKINTKARFVCTGCE